MIGLPLKKAAFYPNDPSPTAGPFPRSFDPTCRAARASRAPGRGYGPSIPATTRARSRRSAMRRRACWSSGSRPACTARTAPAGRSPGITRASCSTDTLHRFGFASRAGSIERGRRLAARSAAASPTRSSACRRRTSRCRPRCARCNRYLRAELAAPSGRRGGPRARRHRASRGADGAVDLPTRPRPLRHGARHGLPGGLTLYDSYHCSRYNTQTRRLTDAMFEDVVGRSPELEREQCLTSMSGRRSLSRTRRRGSPRRSPDLERSPTAAGAHLRDHREVPRELAVGRARRQGYAAAACSRLPKSSRGCRTCPASTAC